MQENITEDIKYKPSFLRINKKINVDPFLENLNNFLEK